MRTAFRVLLVVVAVLMLAGIFAVQWMQRTLLEAGVERLDWEGVRWSGRELTVRELSGLYRGDDGALQFSGNDLRIVLVWRSGPRLELINIGDLDFEWVPVPPPPIDERMLPDPGALDPASDDDRDGSRSAETQDWFSLLDWLPDRTLIRSIQLAMPCRSGRCVITGDAELVSMRTSTSGVDGRLNLNAGSEQLAWTASVREVQDALELTSSLHLSGVPALELSSRWRGEGPATRWQGAVNVPGLPPADWLLAYIEPWLPPATLPVQTLPTGLHMTANWVLEPGHEPEDLADLLAGVVELQATAELPQSWILPELGSIQGALNLQLEGQQGAWLLHQGAGQLRVENITSPTLDDIPLGSRPTALALNLQPEAGQPLGWQQSLPLTLSAEVEGPVAGTLSARLIVTSQPVWHLQIEQGQLSALGALFEHGALRLDDFRLSSTLQGEASAQQVRITLGSAAVLTAARVEERELGLRLDRVRLSAPGLQALVGLEGDAVSSLVTPVQLRAASARYAGFVLDAMQLDWALSGSLDEQQLRLTLGPAAVITAAALSESELELTLADVRLATPNLQLAVLRTEPAVLTLNSRTQLGTSRLEHPSIRPQGWTLNGDYNQDSAGMNWKGAIASLGGLGLDVAFAWPDNRPWSADIRLQEIFLRAANPIAATFADWPELLSLSTGRLTGRVELAGNPHLERAQGRFDLSGAAGIYDRATFEGFTLPLEVSLREERLELTTAGLNLATLDPGLPIGPVTFRGGYSAAMQSLLEGRLKVEHASMNLLGGRLRLEPGEIDLAQRSQNLLVMMDGVELASLFEVYPAEGLSGRGTLDGRLPVSLVDGKLVIDSGHLQARQPGGVLQYRSDKLSEMARSNPGMRELALALDDFRYTVLSSDLDYGEDGVLILGLRLEGNNPDLQQGRPVHLNVRLEEDIPALLASLQLSGQVSDIVQRRVQERLLQRRLNP